MTTIHRVSGMSDAELESKILQLDDTWITFKESARGEGYWVKIEERTQRYAAAFFGVALYGDKTTCLEMAKRYRDNFVMQHRMIPGHLVDDAPSRRYRMTSNLSGLAGVRLSFSRRTGEKTLFGRWVAERAGGPTSFGISRYGFEQAFYMALKERLMYIHQEDRIKDFYPPTKDVLEAHLKERLGENWRSRVYKYETWWDIAEEKFSTEAVGKSLDKSDVIAEMGHG